MFHVYGIPNCETVKKARNWLERNGVEYQFHDYKKSGIDAATLKRWCKQFGYEQLLNQRGTTWRGLDESERSNLNELKAIKLMQAHPSVIKRPLLDTGKELLLGFDEGRYQEVK